MLHFWTNQSRPKLSVFSQFILFANNAFGGEWQIKNWKGLFMPFRLLLTFPLNLPCDNVPISPSPFLGVFPSFPFKMCDYALVRTRSAIALSSPSSLVRTYSVPNLSVSPYYSSYYYPYYSWRSYWPYRYRDYTYSDSYWYDRYYYFSPLYYRSMSPYRRYYYSDYISNPYYSSYPSSYWTRYKSYLYDYDWPSYYRRWYDPYYDSYLRTYRYRSWLLDSMEDSLSKGLAHYRQGTINYNQLYRNWITSNDWHKRHKDWRQLYAWDRDSLKPEGPSPTHQAEWVPAIDRNP